MSSAATHPQTLVDSRGRRRSLLLVCACTALGAAAQILMSVGTHRLGHSSVVGLLGSPAGWLKLATNTPLLTGYSLYGLSAVLLVLALRNAELSILYPIIALTYVWVAILSWALLHEQIHPARMVGIALIIVGVAVLGRGGRR